MLIIQEYLNQQTDAERKYGARTVVLMQVGSFYEIYEYNISFCKNDQNKVDTKGKFWEESIGHAINVSTILNCVLTFENKNKPYSIDNCHKIGFPCLSYEKNRDTLLANDFTVVRIDQDLTSAKGKKSRSIAEVCSPTFDINEAGSIRSSNIICAIYIENQSKTLDLKSDEFCITTGLATIDLVTGQNRVFEFYSKNNDGIHPVQELYRVLTSHNPRELIIHVTDLPENLATQETGISNPYVDNLEKILELSRFDRVTTHLNSVPQEYKKIAYQTEFFNQIFNKTSLPDNVVKYTNEKIIEHLDLEMMHYGRIALILLFQHCNYYNQNVLSRLSKPDLSWLDQDKHLILTHNAIVQLDLIPQIYKVKRTSRRKEIDSLLSVLDETETHLGSRYLRNILQNPMSDPTDIESFYDMIDEMLITKVDEVPLWMYLGNSLKHLPDIEKLQRKLQIKTITPKELAILWKSYIKIINIYLCINNVSAPALRKQLFNQEDANSFNEFTTRFDSIINFDYLESCNIDKSYESKKKWMEFINIPIKQNFYPDVDEQTQILATAENSLKEIVDHLNTFLNKKSDKKLEYKNAKKKQGATKQEPTGTLLTTSRAKANLLALAPINKVLCGTLEIGSFTKNEYFVKSEKITRLSSEIDSSRTFLSHRLLTIYENVVEEMANKYTFYNAVATFVAKIDLIHCYSKISYRYKYNRPITIPSTPTDNNSFVDVKDIRHPIIERIIDGFYVTNNIFLGSCKEPDTSQTNGALLFGVNTAGKSSFAKALGLNIIMAQAGCFTPSNMRYRPYKKIITRLSGSDNIFKGESSFAVEMSELRTILRQADRNTLVLGDELCKGSETHSGVAITASSIFHLIQSECTFLFATHMHELLKLPYIKTIPNNILKICHLSVDYDRTTSNLIYDRKIKEGSGTSFYGLMVAESLRLPEDFVRKANEFLLEITGQNKAVVPLKRSKYNTDLYVVDCSICGKTSSVGELQTHHIIEQSKAVENYVTNDIGTMHKNSKDNLIVLCSTCHKNLHANHQELETLQVSNGKYVVIRPDVPI